MTWTVACEDVRVGLGATPILRADFTHDFTRDGPVLPIMGESGMGKSSLLYVLAALAQPHTGTVAWHDGGNERVDLAAALQPQARKAAVEFRRFRTGFALQDASLVPHLTVRENLEWILRQRERGRSGVSSAHASAGSRADRIEAVVGQLLSPEDRRTRLQKILNSFPSKLSGGERLRMALASAMVHNPPILFADEPTGSLDHQSRGRILECLRAWVDEGAGQRALVLITHHEHEAGVLQASSCLRVRRVEGEDHAIARIERITPGSPDGTP